MGLLLVLVVLSLGQSQEQEKTDRLLQAVVERCFALGGWVTRFDLRVTKNGRGVVASRDMAAGETVVELPHALHLNQDTVARFLPPSVLEAAVDPQVRVAVYLAMERFGVLPRRVARSVSWLRSFFEPAERVSEWSALAELMPDRVDNAAHWGAEEQRTAAQLFRNPPTFVHDLSATWAVLERAETGLTREQFVWGYSMLLSRSFKDLLGRAVLFPVADMLNHSPDPNVKASLAESMFPDVRDTVTFALTRDVAAGEELTITYGDRSSLELLQMYGFTQQPGAHDWAVLDLSVSRLLPRWKVDLLRAVNVSNLFVSVNPSVVWPANVAAFLDSEAPLSSAAFGALLSDKEERVSIASAPIAARLCREAVGFELQRSARLHRLRSLYRTRLTLLKVCASSESVFREK
jgi:hypothetical protein